jgi:hypothetical protein
MQKLKGDRDEKSYIDDYSIFLPRYQEAHAFP